METISQITSQFNGLAPLIVLLFALISRNESALIFSLLVVITNWLIGDGFAAENYNYYYWLFGLVNWAAVELIFKSSEPCDQTKSFVIVFIYINLFGWLTWILYISHIYYNVMCLTNYALMILWLIGGDHGRSDNRGGNFHLCYNPHVVNLPASKERATKT